MSLEKILSIIAFVLLCWFLSFLVRYVPRIDLALVLTLTALLTGYDLFVHRPPR